MPPSLMDWIAICSFIASIPGAIVGLAQLRQMRRSVQNGQPTFRQKHPELIGGLVTLMVVAILIGIGSRFMHRPQPSSISKPAPTAVAPPATPPQETAPQTKPAPKSAPRHHKKSATKPPALTPQPPPPAQATNTAPNGFAGSNSTFVQPTVNNNYGIPAEPGGPTNAQLAESARNIAQRFRDMQKEIE